MKKGCSDCLPGPYSACPAPKGGPGPGKRKRMKKLNHEASKEWHYWKRVALERALDIVEGRSPIGARHKCQSQQFFSGFIAPSHTTSTPGARDATPDAQKAAVVDALEHQTQKHDQ
jgi:hypothetical protein